MANEPTLKRGRITFVIPQGDDKDTNTAVSVSVTTKFGGLFELTLASRFNFASNDTWEDPGGREYPYNLNVAGGVRLSQINGVTIRIVINPVGNDTVIFGFRLELEFDDDDPNTAPVPLIVDRGDSAFRLNQDSRSLTITG